MDSKTQALKNIEEFITLLNNELPLSYAEVCDLVCFIKQEGDLEKAIEIYKKYYFSVLLNYRDSLNNRMIRETNEKIAATKDDDIQHKELCKLSMDDTVAFCMRCFSNSAVAIDKNINFCHNCGSEGTCVNMKGEESKYLRKTIQSAVLNAKGKLGG
jgi:hypothetical protein